MGTSTPDSGSPEPESSGPREPDHDRPGGAKWRRRGAIAYQTVRVIMLILSVITYLEPLLSHSAGVIQ